jgi:hypothetical protein
MDDLISRQDAIRIASGYCHPANIAKELSKLPAAQPDADEWCTDCKEYDHERHCCPRWSRVIRETLKDAQPEIIRCKDCKYWGKRGLCDKWDYYISNDYFYCGCAERRTDE